MGILSPTAPHRSIVAIILILAIAGSWAVPGHMPALAAGSRLTSHTAPRSQRVGAGVDSSGTACVAGSGGCIVSASPAVETRTIGEPRTFTFTCENGAGLLTGSQSALYPTSGCFDVSATLQDISVGAGTSFVSAVCGGVSVEATETVQCEPAVNPLCAAGYIVAPGAGCQPCPPNFSVVAGQCVGVPVNGQCTYGVAQPGSGSTVTCVGPFLPANVTTANQMTVRVKSGSPHILSITFHGYVLTDTAGVCPAATTAVPSASSSFTGFGGAAPPLTVCEFNLTVYERFVELTHIFLSPDSPCGGAIATGQLNYFNLVGQACLVGARAVGQLVVKSGVSCAAEPATGTSAVPDGFPDGATYACASGSLMVMNIPVVGVPLQFQVTNGVLNPTCFPLYAQNPLQPTPTPTPAPTRVPPGGSRTGSPTPTGTVVPEPPPRPPGSAPAYCTAPGSQTATYLTGVNGMINVVGTEAEFYAEAQPSNPLQGSDVNIVGHFSIDSAGVAGVGMYAHFRYPGGREDSCGPAFTDPSGVAQCARNIDDAIPGLRAQVDVDFILNCTDYMTSTSFVPDGTSASTAPPTVTKAPAPNGVCLFRTGAGPLQVQVRYIPALNTQPPVATGFQTVGVFSAPTPVVPTMIPAAPTATRVPMATLTPTPTATPATRPSPSPTFTPTPTNTPVPTSTPVPTPPPPPTTTPSPVRPLHFTLDGARVTASRPHNQCAQNGLDSTVPSQRVCLMMFYMLQSTPRTLARRTVYEIRRGNRVVFSAAYQGTEGPGSVGKHIRFAPYTIPRTLAFGVYTYRATLTIDGATQRREWRFAITRDMTVAPIAVDSLRA